MYLKNYPGIFTVNEQALYPLSNFNHFWRNVTYKVG